MNSHKVFQRMRWNFLIAIGFAFTIAIFAGGVAYASATVGMNDDPPDAFPQSPLTLGEWGDLPSSYGFIVVRPGGAMHQPNVSNLRLGELKDYEHDPIPSNLADGDDLSNQADEDGVTPDENYLWEINETVYLTVTVNGCDSEPCYLNGWIDWGNDDSFDGDQIFGDEQVVNGTHSFAIVIPSDRGYNVGDDVFAHFRLCSSEGIPPTGCNALDGYANDGEVEDYFWEFGPTAVELVSIEATTNYAVPFALLGGALILLLSGGAILAFKRNRA